MPERRPMFGATEGQMGLQKRKLPRETPLRGVSPSLPPQAVTPADPMQVGQGVGLNPQLLQMLQLLQQPQGGR